MKERFLTRYIGCTTGAIYREYAFGVREGSSDWREFTFAIPNEAFCSRRASYQDAPAICSLRLQRELTSHGSDPACKKFDISDKELEEHRTTHAPRKNSRFNSGAFHPPSA